MPGEAIGARNQDKAAQGAFLIEYGQVYTHALTLAYDTSSPDERAEAEDYLLAAPVYSVPAREACGDIVRVHRAADKLSEETPGEAIYSESRILEQFKRIQDRCAQNEFRASLRGWALVASIGAVGVASTIEIAILTPMVATTPFQHLERAGEVAAIFVTGLGGIALILLGSYMFLRTLDERHTYRANRLSNT